jgi:hypothetical protein
MNTLRYWYGYRGLATPRAPRHAAPRRATPRHADGGTVHVEARHHGRIWADATSKTGQVHATRGRRTAANAARRVCGGVVV